MPNVKAGLLAVIFWLERESLVPAVGSLVKQAIA
jgi:hypothetical protein